MFCFTEGIKAAKIGSMLNTHKAFTSMDARYTFHFIFLPPDPGARPLQNKDLNTYN